MKTEKQVRKAVVKQGGTLFDLKAAVILYRINGYENAMEYVAHIKHRGTYQTEMNLELQ